MQSSFEFVRNALVFIVAGTAILGVLNFSMHLLMPRFFAKVLPLRKVQPLSYNRDFLIHDIKTFLTGFPPALLYVVFLYGLWDVGILSFSTESVSVIEFVGQFLLFLIGFDFLYYWLHRFLHYEPFYSKIHMDHHINTAPTAMTTITFHPLENIAVLSLFPLLGVIFNLHLYVVLAGTAAFMTYNFYAHSAYEIVPANWYQKFPFKYLSTSTSHDLHHSRFNYHFAVFTTIWDRMFGTLDPNLVEFHHQLMSDETPQSHNLEAEFSREKANR